MTSQTAEVATHTPGPWRVAPAAAYVSGGLNIDAGENGQGGYVCLVGGDPSDPRAVADAALIVRAVNSHADLVAALKASEALAMRAPNPFEHDCEWCASCVARVDGMRRAALAKAGAK